jgi:hypothetical protein
VYNAAGVPQHVFADRYIFNIPGIPKVRLVLDHTVVDPQTAAYSERAATEQVYAARVAAEVKERRRYTPLLQVGDQLLVPAAESHGGIHPAFRSALGKLAGATLGDAQGGEFANRGPGSGASSSTARGRSFWRCSCCVGGSTCCSVSA